MPTHQQYEQMIGRLRHPGLVRLWDQIVTRSSSPTWDPGKALEYLVLRAFQLEGATVAWPFEISGGTTAGKRTIEQIDGVVYADGISCVFECKDHADRMDYDAIAVLRDQLTRRPAGVIGSCVSTSGFTVTALPRYEQSLPRFEKLRRRRPPPPDAASSHLQGDRLRRGGRRPRRGDLYDSHSAGSWRPASRLGSRRVHNRRHGNRVKAPDH